MWVLWSAAEQSELRGVNTKWIFSSSIPWPIMFFRVKVGDITVRKSEHMWTKRGPYPRTLGKDMMTASAALTVSSGRWREPLNILYLRSLLHKVVMFRMFCYWKWTMLLLCLHELHNILQIKPSPGPLPQRFIFILKVIKTHLEAPHAYAWQNRSWGGEAERGQGRTSGWVNF